MIEQLNVTCGSGLKILLGSIFVESRKGKLTSENLAILPASSTPGKAPGLLQSPNSLGCGDKGALGFVASHIPLLSLSQHLASSILVIRQKVHSERLLFTLRHLYRVLLKPIVWVSHTVPFVLTLMRVCLSQQGLAVGTLKELCSSLVRYSLACHHVVDHVLGIMGWWQPLGTLMRLRHP